MTVRGDRMEPTLSRGTAAPTERTTLKARDRLQPALLDRLTDIEPQRRTETADTQLVDDERLRTAVLRDLSWLLNTANAEGGSIDWSSYEQARASVLNYGMRPLAGRPVSGLERLALEQSIRDAILRFEPRILPESVEVRSMADDALGAHRPNVLAFEIKGTLWLLPYPVELVLRSDLDLETGAVSVKSAGSD